LVAPFVTAAQKFDATVTDMLTPAGSSSAAVAAALARGESLMGPGSTTTSQTYGYANAVDGVAQGETLDAQGIVDATASAIDCVGVPSIIYQTPVGKFNTDNFNRNPYYTSAGPVWNGQAVNTAALQPGDVLDFDLQTNNGGDDSHIQTYYGSTGPLTDANGNPYPDQVLESSPYVNPATGIGGPRFTRLSTSITNYLAPPPGLNLTINSITVYRRNNVVVPQ